MSKKKGPEVKDEVFFPRNKKEIEQEKARMAQESSKHAEIKRRIALASKPAKKK